ncbi:MAG: universal stress protein [Pseudomonadota bacterium]
MFKHILVPTDGSPLSESAVMKGIELAHALGARVTGLHVTPHFHVLTYRPDMLEETREEFDRDSRAAADRHLAFVRKTADEMGVPCATLRTVSEEVDQSIIDTAREHACDLIVMASHGRRGLGRVLMGSQTQRVTTHSNVPVLVCR